MICLYLFLEHKWKSEEKGTARERLGNFRDSFCKQGKEVPTLLFGQFPPPRKLPSACQGQRP